LVVDEEESGIVGREPFLVCFLFHGFAFVRCAAIANSPASTRATAARDRDRVLQKIPVNRNGQLY
jgi:hypothetical protein